MRSRTYSILAALLMIATAAPLAAVSGGADGADAAAALAKERASHVPIALTGCDYVEILVKADPAKIRPFVPVEFTLIVAADGFTTVLLGGADCDDAVSGESRGPAAFGWTSARIQKPADPALAGDSAGLYLFRLEHFVVEGDVYFGVADAVGAERIPLSTIDAAVDPAVSTLDLSAEGFRHRVTSPLTALSAAPVETTTGGVRWRELGAVPGGYAILEATLVAGPGSGNSAGVVEASPLSVGRTVLGPVNVGPVNYGVDYAVLDGFMGFVPRE